MSFNFLTVNFESVYHTFKNVILIICLLNVCINYLVDIFNNNGVSNQYHSVYNQEYIIILC